MASLEFVEPKRKILEEDDMPKWLKSEAYSELLGFIISVNQSLKGKLSTTECIVSENVQKLLDILEKLSNMVDEIPCIDQPQRFGNKAFAKWHAQLIEKSFEMVAESLPKDLQHSVIEVKDYLDYSFGNEVRIDYGTGHEFSFVAFLCCYFKLGVLKQEDQVAVAIKVFERYLDLARKLQLHYRMEAAGSRGVWGLDDYQFMPFLWGSSQFLMNPLGIEPNDFPKEEIVKQHHHQFMFLQAIQFIQKTKTGPFFEHSNQLWNISGAQSWTKINKGMLKMYKDKVLGKFPVVQHFRFGNIFPIEPVKK